MDGMGWQWRKGRMKWDSLALNGWDGMTVEEGGENGMG
jgi:hypothetical protein